MKTQNQKTIELVRFNKKRDVYNNIKWWVINTERYDNLMGDTFITLISESSSNISLKRIATELMDSNTQPTKEVSIQMTNEIFDNKDLYLGFLSDFSDKSKNIAFEVIKEMHPEYSDAQIWSKIG